MVKPIHLRYQSGRDQPIIMQQLAAGRPISRWGSYGSSHDVLQVLDVGRDLIQLEDMLKAAGGQMVRAAGGREGRRRPERRYYCTISPAPRRCVAPTVADWGNR